MKSLTIKVLAKRHYFVILRDNQKYWEDYLLFSDVILIGIIIDFRLYGMMFS